MLTYIATKRSTCNFKSINRLCMREASNVVSDPNTDVHVNDLEQGSGQRPLLFFFSLPYRHCKNIIAKMCEPFGLKPIASRFQRRELYVYSRHVRSFVYLVHVCRYAACPSSIHVLLAQNLHHIKNKTTRTRKFRLMNLQCELQSYKTFESGNSYNNIIHLNPSINLT